VNTNPYLGTPNEYISKLVPKMIDDMLEIVVDPMFPPRGRDSEKEPNEFELIYCESGSSYHEGAFSARSQYT